MKKVFEANSHISSLRAVFCPVMGRSRGPKVDLEILERVELKALVSRASTSGDAF